jgi:superfamily II DNA or RNA helicase
LQKRGNVLALPHLVKYIYTHGTDEVIRRGKKIHAIGFAELVEYDELFGTATFRVRDDSYSTFYKVHIHHFRDPNATSLRCGCPYNLGDICRHETAALLQLQEMLDRGQLQAGQVQYDQRHTVVKMKTIDLKNIRLLCAQQTLVEAETYLRTKKAAIEYAENETVRASVQLEGIDYEVLIKKNEERNFDTSCDFDDTRHPLCLPKVIVLLQLLNTHGANYFDSIRNWDKEKNKLLEAYGYSLNDDLTGKFEFAYKDGKPFLRVLDATIKRVAMPTTFSRPVLFPEAVAKQPEKKIPTVKAVEMTRRLGVVLNFNKKGFPAFSVDAVIGEASDQQQAFAGKVEKLDITRFVELNELSENDRELLQLIRKLQAAEINKYVSRNSPFSGIWDSIVHQDEDDLPAETKELIAEYMLPKLQRLFAAFGSQAPFYCLELGKPFKTAQLLSLDVTDQPLVPQFFIKKNSHYTIFAQVKVGALELALTENECASPLLFLHNGQCYCWKNKEVTQLLETFLPDGKMIKTTAAWKDTLQQLILPLSRTYSVRFDKPLMKEVKGVTPEPRVILTEKGDYLVFKPVFVYEGYESSVTDGEKVLIPQSDGILVVHRNKEKEEVFLQRLANLHSGFVENTEEGTYALKGTEVLRNNWFFLFIDAMKETKTTVFGFESLQHYRFNTAKPKTQIFISSNTDWFDAKVNIAFGDQQITVADVKKALANNQQFVQLNDGTLGILPEEWLKKYALLFRVGEGKNNSIKLSRFHQSVVDELYENRDNSELELQLEEKYEQLRQFDKINPIEPPASLEQILRPYQVSGYQWLNYLKEVKWGGILADDMGLGKTVQALSYLEYYKKTEGSLRALVVCPTTLIYNWENEIKKFTPSLRNAIHHGPTRLRKKEALENFDVIITTYGTLRSDIKLLSTLAFDYVILDESQAIKNPSSKVTRAAQLLQAKHRLCMSGTPLQNNTFDVYAQMNFLNPGMLGSVEFFRQEFAVPIDKLGEPDRKEHLRKLLYPFILRRTKEQVARDLPEKQEMVLFCEMEKEQRDIYEAYRNDYRNQILGSIESQGIQRSQLAILQGLMKLRQICDSPAILNEQEAFPNYSIKLDELARQLKEDISNHKALIFSQFLGMLALIRSKLEELEIPYVYFDGSTSAPDREKAIQQFQQQDRVRVFLISLKAGGVGLNLTAADYVYIMDPWWNPAVEQQAIDRTHRIGQTKNIFAYRMICKDSIEDKILQLQERKRALAKDIIADDTGFVKSLTREDVEYLFS